MKSIKCILYISLNLILFLLPFSVQAQTEPATGTIINNYASVTNIAGTTLSVDTTSGFFAGDRALLIQMKGATVDRTDSATHGDISSYGSAGRFEFVDIATVGAGSVVLQSAPTVSFQVSGAVQLVRVPIYDDQTLNGTLSASPWDGTKGGVLAIDATGTLTITGDLDVTGLGYVGGALVTEIPYDSCASDQTNYTGPLQDGTGNKGEGIVTDVAAHRARRGHNANGGGGGNITDGGGGGGGNYGAGGLGGRELDLCDDDGHFGGLGGQGLDYTPRNRVFLGGGGGSGSEVSQTATGGPRTGGGIVVIRAAQLVSSGGRILTNGLDANSDNVNGADGGGAGGSVAIAVTHSISGSLTIEAHGGDGGDEFNTSFAHGTGGGGGGGAIVLNGATCAQVNWSATQGLAGISDLGTAVGDPNWGAVDGEPGNCLSPFNALPQLVFDYGDAPDTYGDASHTVPATPAIYLGSVVPDVESDTLLGGDAGANADGDDVDSSDDEDAIASFPALAVEDTTYTISAIPVTNTTGSPANLVAWVDFDQSGTFDTDEAATVSVPNGATSASLTWSSLPGIAAGTTYVRFRLTTDTSIATGTANTSVPTGAATDGEVEDYVTTIQTAFPPFTCDNSIYQLLGNNTQLRRVTFSASGASFVNIGDPTPTNTNAGWGYNELDNYIYGVRTGTTDLFRVDANGTFTNLGSVTGIGNGSVAGDVDPNGILIFRSNNGTYYRVDLMTQPYAEVGSFTISGDAAGQNFIDIAYNPADDLLYAIRNSIVYSIDPVTGASVQIMTASLGLDRASGAWFDEDGILYAYDNNTNTYYAMNLSTQQTAIIGVSNIDEEGRNDGTSCRGPRPVPLGLVTGTVYEDLDENDTYDAGTDTPLPNITISIYEENGTPGDTGDDTLISSVSTDANGFYTISLILAFAGNTYRVEVDTADPDLPVERRIGTPNPLSNVLVVDGGTTANQDFGFNVGISISGTVYEDVQPNGTLDSTETGTGEALFVKLLSRTGTTCNAPALEAVAADPGSGAFAFTNVFAGNYCLLVDTNNTLTDTTPDPASAWRFTGPNTGLRFVVAAAQHVPNQHFGLYHGSELSGTVFQDTGNPSGTANDGIQNGAETGMANVALNLTDCASTVHDTATTDASGAYTLRIPSTVANGAGLCVVETNPVSHLSTGASVGTTGGSYDRPSDTIALTYSLGTNYSGVDFGDVPSNLFVPDGQQSGLPGTVLWYPHTFTAGSAGTVTFSTSGVSSPVVNGWSETLYHDSNCNSAIDSGESQITSIALNAGEQVCILMREAIPLADLDGATRQVTVSASFSYSNASPALDHVLQRIDLTTVGETTAAGLHLLKAVDKDQAKPGEVLTYTITYSNRSAEPLSNIVIHDKTPAFTVFQNAVCGSPLPADLSACTVTQQPVANGTGAIAWTLGGTLRSGHQGTVIFSIQIQE